MGFSQLARTNDYEILLSGQSIPDDHLRELHADVASTQGDLERIGGALVHHIRQAAGSNEAVGQGVLLNILPRSVVKQEITARPS